MPKPSARTRSKASQSPSLWNSRGGPWHDSLRGRSELFRRLGSPGSHPGAEGRRDCRGRRGLRSDAEGAVPGDLGALAWAPPPIRGCSIALAGASVQQVGKSSSKGGRNRPTPPCPARAAHAGADLDRPWRGSITNWPPWASIPRSACPCTLAHLIDAGIGRRHLDAHAGLEVPNGARGPTGQIVLGLRRQLDGSISGRAIREADHGGPSIRRPPGAFTFLGVGHASGPIIKASMPITRGVKSDPPRRRIPGRAALAERPPRGEHRHRLLRGPDAAGRYKIYDANGVEFLVRGINHTHWWGPGQQLRGHRGVPQDPGECGPGRVRPNPGADTPAERKAVVRPTSPGGSSRSSRTWGDWLHGPRGPESRRRQLAGPGECAMAQGRMRRM